MHYEKLNTRDSIINATGDFWIGDPCYVVPDDYWIPLCDNWQAYDKKHQDDPDFKHHYVGVVEDEPSGICFYLWSTAYGDGQYRLFVDGVEVASLPVDAGTLSAIPVALIKEWNDRGLIGDYEKLGHVVSADKLQGELVCEGGDAFWGNMRLPTGYEEESDEEDPWAEEEEEYYSMA